MLELNWKRFPKRLSEAAPATSFLVASLLIASWCSAQSPDSGEDRKPEVEAAKKFQAFAREVASGYELRSGGHDSRQFTRVAEPILRWSNPLGGQQAHGEIFLWTNTGLPAAVVSINEFTRVNGKVDGEHEWCSLTNGPIVASGPHRWSPETAGISFLPLPIEETLADSPTRRLRQMRELANRFSGNKTTRVGESRALRLLPQPIYRYQSKDADIPDGGLFALVEATDPEALLLLEARPSKSTYTWQYAFARLNSVKITASFDGQQVWEAPQLPGSDVYGRADKPYSAFLVK
jgi:hypothetical protein